MKCYPTTLTSFSEEVVLPVRVFRNTIPHSFRSHNRISLHQGGGRSSFMKHEFSQGRLPTSYYNIINMSNKRLGASLAKDANFLGRIWTRCSKKAISCWHFAELVKWDMNRWQANTVQGTANKRLPTPLEGRSVKVKRGEKDRDKDKMHVFRWRIPIQWQLLDYENMLDEDTLK